MKPSGVLPVMVLWVCVAAGPLRAGGAELGTLPCLRAGRTNSLNTCLSCHDGSLARNLKLTMAVQTGGAPGSEHPVPIAYAEAYARRPREFVPPTALPPEIQLVQGQVQCVTCHTTNAQGQWVPVRGSGGRPLCLSCHRK